MWHGVYAIVTLRFEGLMVYLATPMPDERNQGADFLEHLCTFRIGHPSPASRRPFRGQVQLMRAPAQARIVQDVQFHE